MNKVAKQLILFLESDNIADDIDDDVLGDIGSRVKTDYDNDIGERKEWEDRLENIVELAKLVSKLKTDDEGKLMANVKHPVLATAAIQFAARALPNIIKGKKVVKGKIIGRDESGDKTARSNRVADHMNFQIMDQMGGWVDGVDEMLHRLPLEGCGFKKTYRDFNRNRNVSKYIPAIDLVIPFYAKDFENVRKTHRVYLTKNQIVERMRNGVFREFEYGKPDSSTDPDGYHLFLEQHRWYDLDGDGYEEPYAITVHEETEKVVRITARWDEDGVEFNEDGDLALIRANEHFTRFLFMPSVDGSVYGMGFGSLLEPMAETINATLNMLLDAGKRASVQGGFISNRVRLKKSNPMSFSGGEWKWVKATGDELRRHIVPLEVKEPSLVLFQLLGLMLEASEKLSSMSDVLTGEVPSGDVPATTTLALIEQGLKVYSAVHRRIHRGLKGELGKLRRLNELYLDPKEYVDVVDDPKASADDYVTAGYDVIPITDENEVSDTQKLVKAEAWMVMIGKGYNDDYIKRKYAEAMGVDDIELMMQSTPPPIPPEEIRLEKELLLKEKEVKLKEQQVRNETMKTMQELVVMRAKAIKSLADAEAKEEGIQLERYKQDVDLITQTIQQENEYRRQQIEKMKIAADAMRGANGNQSGGLPAVAGGANNESNTRAA